MARAGVLAWLLGVSVALSSSLAQAEITKTQCIQANTNAQTLRRDGKLAEAREQLRMCSDPKCPGLVSADCIKRLDELENAQPTVIFDVKDEAGHDLSDVKVTMDGRPFQAKLDGTAAAVDLGEHTLTFTTPGRPSVTQKVVFREGDKARRIAVTLAGDPATSPEPVTSPSAEPTPPPADVGQAGSSPRAAPSRPQRTWGYVVAGTGLAGLAVGGVFGYLAIQDKQRQTENCESTTNCRDYAEASAAHKDAKTHGTISTVAFIAGAALTGVGIVLWATAKPAQHASTAPHVTLASNLGPGAAQLELTGAF